MDVSSNFKAKMTFDSSTSLPASAEFGRRLMPQEADVF
jgi:hypothetical protein